MNPKQRWKDDPYKWYSYDIKARRPRDWHKKFKWDAPRFANKTYAVFEAARRWQKCVMANGCVGEMLIHTYTVL